MEFVLCMPGLSYNFCASDELNFFRPIFLLDQKKIIHFCFYFPFFSFTEFGNTGIGTGCTSDPVIVRAAIILIDTMLRSEATDRSFNNEFESDIVSGYGSLLCGHRSRQVVFCYFHTSLWHPPKNQFFALSYGFNMSEKFVWACVCEVCICLCEKEAFTICRF